LKFDPSNEFLAEAFGVPEAVPGVCKTIFLFAFYIFSSLKSIKSSFSSPDPTSYN